MDEFSFKYLKKLNFKNLAKIKFKNVNRKKKTIENLYLLSPNVIGAIGRTVISSIFGLVAKPHHRCSRKFSQLHLGLIGN